MNTKEIALCSVFSSIAISLDQVRIPALFAPIQFYFWEIPIVIVVLLFGYRLGFSVAVLTAFGQALIFPRALGFLFPIWNLIEMSTIIVGVSLAQMLTGRTLRTTQMQEFRIKSVVYLTSSAIAFRFAITPFVSFFMYKYIMPIIVGQSFSDEYIIALIPALLVFDAVLVLYTVPTGYLIAKTVNKNLKVSNKIV